MQVFRFDIAMQNLPPMQQPHRAQQALGESPAIASKIEARVAPASSPEYSRIT
jgi:hypothetical protein